MAKKMPNPPPAPSPEVPFDEQQLLDAERRWREIMGPAGMSFEAPAQRGLLRTNPPEAIERRLRRMGVPAEKARAAVGNFAGRVVFAPITTEAPAEEPVGLERILGRNELMEFRYLEGGHDAGRAVGRIAVRDVGGRTVGHGTGFLVAPRLLLTNNHVLRSSADAAASVVQFNYQNGRDGRPLPAAEFALEPGEFFTTSRELDFSLVAVRALSADGERLSRFGHRRLNATEGEILAGECVTIIQHPNGEPKQIALRENQVLRLPDAEDRFLHYKTDTTPGSSGSPVFNDDWEVVALHHSGVPERDAQRRILTTDGKVWKQGMGEHRIKWIANEGVRVTAIVAHLRQLQDLDAAQQRLLAELLDGADGSSPPVTTGEEPSSRPRPGPDPATLVPPPTPASAPSGQAVFTIPLQVAIRIGPAGPAMLTAAVSPAPGRRPAAPPLPDASALLDEAKAELERHAAQPYYDEDADERDRDSYYEGLSADLGPRKLFQALRRLLRDTHEPQPAYRPSKHVYPWVDLQPNRRLRSVYSGQQFDPLEFIRDDIAIEQARQARIEELLASEAAADPGRLEAELDLLEAQSPYNCEHVVPQSWFGKREPMRGDLHHLFACESGCNSFRGNTPYFDFGPEEEAVRQGCGRRESNRFEPTSGKGAVARATLYFLVRYPGEINRTESEYTRDRLLILLDWHREYPADEYEWHRNQAVFAKQGNRNPFIDYPEWADIVDFRLGLGPS